MKYYDPQNHMPKAIISKLTEVMAKTWLYGYVGLAVYHCSNLRIHFSYIFLTFLRLQATYYQIREGITTSSLNKKINNKYLTTAVQSIVDYNLSNI